MTLNDGLTIADVYVVYKDEVRLKLATGGSLGALKMHLSQAVLTAREAGIPLTHFLQMASTEYSTGDKAYVLIFSLTNLSLISFDSFTVASQPKSSPVLTNGGVLGAPDALQPTQAGFVYVGRGGKAQLSAEGTMDATHTTAGNHQTQGIQGNLGPVDYVIQPTQAAVGNLTQSLHQSGHQGLMRRYFPSGAPTEDPPAPSGQGAYQEPSCMMGTVVGVPRAQQAAPKQGPPAPSGQGAEEPIKNHHV